ncbi:hypothetical protein SAMN05446037_104514 [Anaerovirgula multivorans]|uniref:Uncharacterized protein n=1 Tax=Anaerovirgula multivorans TaxID=312168 RepID=A0A239KAW6_9FIRM|nr:hypothetical protein [Anaerovirgula multivorans]SNT15151.1 hypothetical protein SAMN05446037_104514 [Anaerovirgula multivorans]
MSRIERKIEHRKKKRQLKIFLFLIFIFMIIGILSVDSAIREMLALEDTRVFGYEAQQDYILFYLMGEQIYIEQEKVEEIQVFIEEIYYNIIEQVNNMLERIKNVGLNRHFFSNIMQNIYQL